MSILWIAVVVGTAIVVLAVIFRDRIRGRQTPAAIRPGNPLPAFEAIDEDGNPVSSADLMGTPAILLFVRGTWCPFCSRQVQNLTGVYKEINDCGARLVLVTPQPLDTTRRVANLFGVQFEFWLDESLDIARQFGLLLESGVPKDHRGEYGSDTLWPTSLVVDSKGIIRHTEVSRFVVDRPNPQKLLTALKKLPETK